MDPWTLDDDGTPPSPAAQALQDYARTLAAIARSAREQDAAIRVRDARAVEASLTRWQQAVEDAATARRTAERWTGLTPARPRTPEGGIRG